MGVLWAPTSELRPGLVSRVEAGVRLRGVELYGVAAMATLDAVETAPYWVADGLVALGGVGVRLPVGPVALHADAGVVRWGSSLDEESYGYWEADGALPPSATGPWAQAGVDAVHPLGEHVSASLAGEVGLAGVPGVGLVVGTRAQLTAVF